MFDSFLTDDSLDQPDNPLGQTFASNASGLSVIPVPSVVPVPTSSIPSVLTPVVCDERAIARLVETLLDRSGLTINEAARRLGVTRKCVWEYTAGRIGRPSLLWFVRFVQLCGGRLTLEMPEKRR